MPGLPNIALCSSVLPPTPLVPVRLEPGGVEVWCKLEYLNPSGSTKDRIARHILAKAWRSGTLRSGMTVTEASSGSTSIALALVCAQMGLRFVAFIPHGATSERSLMVEALGGEARRVTGDMSAVLAAADAAAREHGWFYVRQFENPENVAAQRDGTGAEILQQLPGGHADIIVSGVGTGGTLRGLWEAFAAAGCEPVAIAALPTEAMARESANPECATLCFSSAVPGVAQCMSKLYADWKATRSAGTLLELPVPDDECLDYTRRLWQLGFPAGPSSGLNYAAAIAAAHRLGRDKVIVTVFPDRMERYFSHRVFTAR